VVQALGTALQPLLHTGSIVGLVQAQDRDAVGVFGQIAAQIAPHPAGGGIGVPKLGVLLLQLFQAALELVVVGVIHQGLALVVVELQFFQAPGQFLHFALDCFQLV